MSVKEWCPACGLYTSGVAHAFRHGNPCPVCGLSSAAAAELVAARARGASVELVERAAKAEVRAGKAEAEAATLRETLARIAQIAGELARGELAGG